MATSYLDKTGLAHLWDKIKSIIPTKTSELTNDSDFITKERGIEFIRGTWTAASETWTGESADSELYDGKQIILYMPFAGSGNATLNLTLADGTTTGAKNVYFEGSTRFTTHKPQNSQLPLIYHKAFTLSNGTTYEGWWYIANRDTNDYASHIGFAYGMYVPSTNLYRYLLLFTKNETTLIPANAVNSATGTSKTLTTESFDPFGQVYYYNSTTTVNANASIGANLRTQHALVDLRYSFNTGSTLTANRAIYLVLDPQSDGSVKLASSPITQTLPTTEDGKLYKYLGKAYDTYRIILNQDKPVYYYANGALRIWTNADTSSSLADLTDTAVNSPADGQVLKYDSTSSKWVNGDVSGVLYVTITGNQSNGFATTANFDDVYAAYQNGYDIKAVNGSTIYDLSLITSAGIGFSRNTANKLEQLTWTKSSGTISYNGWSAASITVSTLNDTTISSPATGQILTYDGTTSKWVNTTSPYMTASQVNELIAAALAQYGDGDTASYGFEDASEVSY